MMESGHLRHPSFGFRWEFVPSAPLAFAGELERMGFSHWSLRLETFLKYGGPLTGFLEERQKHAQLRFFSDYLPAVPLPEWDPVHELAAVSLLEKSAPARLTCRNELPQVPPPLAVLTEMLARLPLTTEVNVLARTEADLTFIDRAGEVSASIELAAWDTRWTELMTRADLVTEIEIDPLTVHFDAADVAGRAVSLLEASRGNEPLDVTFRLPVRSEDIDVAAKRAATVRDLLMVNGWSPK